MSFCPGPFRGNSSLLSSAAWRELLVQTQALRGLGQMGKGKDRLIGNLIPKKNRPCKIAAPPERAEIFVSRNISVFMVSVGCARIWSCQSNARCSQLELWLIHLHVWKFSRRSKPKKKVICKLLLKLGQWLYLPLRKYHPIQMWQPQTGLLSDKPRAADLSKRCLVAPRHHGH